MIEFYYNLISSKTVLIVGAYLGAVLTIWFLLMFIRKCNRDERGWKIFGKASLVSFVWFIVFVNFIAKMSGRIDYTSGFGYIQYGNTIQWIYNTTFIVEILAVLILRKKE